MIMSNLSDEMKAFSPEEITALLELHKNERRRDYDSKLVLSEGASLRDQKIFQELTESQAAYSFRLMETIMEIRNNPEKYFPFNLDDAPLDSTSYICGVDVGIMRLTMRGYETVSVI